MASGQPLNGLRPLETIVSRSVAGLCVVAAFLAATVTSGQTAEPRDNTIVIRGQKQELHHHPATATPLNKKVLFVPGVGGWRRSSERDAAQHDEGVDWLAFPVCARPSTAIFR